MEPRDLPLVQPVRNRCLTRVLVRHPLVRSYRKKLLQGIFSICRTARLSVRALIGLPYAMNPDDPRMEDPNVCTILQHSHSPAGVVLAGYPQVRGSVSETTMHLRSDGVRKVFIAPGVFCPAIYFGTALSSRGLNAYDRVKTNEQGRRTKTARLYADSSSPNKDYCSS